MKEHQIPFNGPMVRAILEGQKRQTRRLVMPTPQMVDEKNIVTWDGDAAALMRLFDQVGRSCPYGHSGDQLWVRETCRAEELPDGLDGVRFLADDAFVPIKATAQAAEDWLKLRTYRGKRGATVPSIHMPRWACRILLEITSIRVERLNDISNEDAKAEGAGCDANGNHRLMFEGIWNDIYGAGAWESNPWVWVIEFKKLEGDQNGS